MKTFKKISKILFFPILTIGTLLLLLYTTNLFSYFFQNIIYDTLITVYRFLYSSQQVIYPFDTVGLYGIAISLFFILISLFIHIFLKDKDLRIGIKITTGLFIVLFLICFCWTWQNKPQNREIRPVEVEDEKSI